MLRNSDGNEKSAHRTRMLESDAFPRDAAIFSQHSLLFHLASYMMFEESCRVK